MARAAPASTAATEDYVKSLEYEIDGLLATLRHECHSANDVSKQDIDQKLMRDIGTTVRAVKNKTDKKRLQKKRDEIVALYYQKMFGVEESEEEEEPQKEEEEEKENADENGYADADQEERVIKETPKHPQRENNSSTQQAPPSLGEPVILFVGGIYRIVYYLSVDHHRHYYTLVAENSDWSNSETLTFLLVPTQSIYALTTPRQPNRVLAETLNEQAIGNILSDYEHAVEHNFEQPPPTNTATLSPQSLQEINDWVLHYWEDPAMSQGNSRSSRRQNATRHVQKSTPSLGGRRQNRLVNSTKV